MVAATPRPRIIPRPFGEPAPLALSQEELWVRETSKPGTPPLYNECITVRMAGELDPAILERSLVEIIRRHEIWRTSFDVRNGQPVQIVHPAPETFRLPAIDLRSLPGPRREAEAQRLVGEIVRQPFDLKEGPLLRAKLIRMHDAEHRLFLCAHLSIVDGVSVYQVFPSELAAFYSAFSSGRSPQPQRLPVQFGDYAYAQRRWLHGEEHARQMIYWRKQLAGSLPVLNWPVDRTWPPRESFHGTIRPFVMRTGPSEAARELSRREGVTLFMTLTAVFTSLLHRYTQQEDIIIGTLSPAGRKRSEAEKLLGYLINPVALRFDLTGNPTFRELLRQTQRVTLEAIMNDEVPPMMLARELQPNVDWSRNPFFSVAISLQPPLPALALEWSVTSMDVDSGGAPWDLYLAFIDRPEGILGRAQYNPDLFDPKTITRMLEHFQRLLEALAAGPGKHLSEVEFPLVVLSTDNISLNQA
ncbi:MAG TPA: condensation domain-containing protein [Candidatus Saccharimonadales bacterium]|nr:condensation domain-containing protein [Candidatus Saccharimonadales bacterium]